MIEKEWALTYNELATGKRSYGQESLLTLSNGFMGWRGAPIFSKFSADHYPGLYVAGVFNRTTTPIAGRDVINEDLVNLPNPQLFEFYLDGQKVQIDAETIVERQSTLNFKCGELTEHLVVKTEQGLLTLDTVKAVDPIDYHVLALGLNISSDFDAELRIESSIDGTVLNQNVERYRDFDSKEFTLGLIDEQLLHAMTKTTEIEIVMGAKTFGSSGEFKKVGGREGHQTTQDTFELQAGQFIPLTKIISVATSLETNDPEKQVLADLEQTSLSQVRSHSRSYWQKVWETADIKLDSDDPDLQLMIHMNIFQIRQAAQHQANQHLDASVGSRALTGEGYRGHIFWDELFVIPYYAANDPQTARDILQYRINRIEAAQENAHLDGEKGAMFPWQSGVRGDEQSQFIHLNPVNGEWEPDNSRKQRHVSLAIVYNLWVYTQVTGDYSFLNEGGLELLLETSKFWLEKVELGEDGRYHLAGVMGPDEFHEAYPGAKEGGIKDNAYTNLMLVWALNWLLDLSQNVQVDFKDATDKHHFDHELMERAQAVTKKMALTINEDGIIAQYAGYFDLKKLDFKQYQQKYGDIHRIDRLLKAEGLSPDDFQVAKQADTLMTIYNLGAQKMAELVQQLGYHLPVNWLELNQKFYLDRTVHGSTTSRPVFAGIDVTLGHSETALADLKTAIGSDYYDIQGGTTAEGIHIGVMGETLAVVQNDFGGVTLRDGQIVVNPKLPETWRRLEFTQNFRGILLRLIITRDQVEIVADQAVMAEIYGQKVELTAGITKTVLKGMD
ncbi:MAG: glycoside hydrolase family 65 protein [Lactobacillaceae bacterium]|jgi:trehalose 6-phosphate phosphorylase|nr:glycoside hydrolase family 65 protein [Lactobacillaceae bacterium]